MVPPLSDNISKFLMLMKALNVEKCWVGYNVKSLEHDTVWIKEKLNIFIEEIKL